jgi:hypothetical protein
MMILSRSRYDSSGILCFNTHAKPLILRIAASFLSFGLPLRINCDPLAKDGVPASACE